MTGGYAPKHGSWQQGWGGHSKLFLLHFESIDPSTIHAIKPPVTLPPRSRVEMSCLDLDRLANHHPHLARAEKGVTTYTLSPNRQRLFPNFWHTAIFNTFRRFRHQVLYVAPPFIVAYSLMDWAVERNEYLNSKAGRAEAGDE
ncbi:uncharacterized protein BHQ10_009204 [Talaromyces amestolkiae]|uniref:Cytochrome b-c1 complex subunit 8 n=1 Tax=Talaromyces amestolkiae TaxID=1196081 RepID=A0A364LBK5_TALAM|nr:uncharacterized protein BHQ10_009204 [Talaromyces amestolkiae]RAO73192.1 hypothetical protein BHQ10_009204 [Talaromyces amestolkiae]